MHVDPETAAALGFPKSVYTDIERERRWTFRAVPRDRIVRTEVITDLYVTGSHLRLREVRPLGGTPPTRRLSRKVDVDARTRLITSIYLPEDEYVMLASTLRGVTIEKVRHRLRTDGSVRMHVDELRGSLDGLLLAEVDAPTDEALASFPTPELALREVTEDVRFTGGWLATNGRPPL